MCSFDGRPANGSGILIVFCELSQEFASFTRPTALR